MIGEIISGLHNSWQLSIINSIVYGIGTLPEAKIGLVKRMPKREMDSCRLHVVIRARIDPYVLD
jgi:hypothetical protein